MESLPAPPVSPGRPVAPVLDLDRVLAPIATRPDDVVAGSPRTTVLKAPTMPLVERVLKWQALMQLRHDACVSALNTVPITGDVDTPVRQGRTDAA